MPGITVSDQYDALLTTTLRNVSTAIPDQISKNNKLFWAIKNAGMYNASDSLGYEVVKPVLFALKGSNVLGNYDAVDTTPIEGATISRWSYTQQALGVTISDMEVSQNSGENQLINLVTLKTKQGTLGLTQDWNQRFIQGNGANVATQITTKYTDPTTGATFVDPLFSVVAKSPTSGTVGAIDSAVYTWWRNIATSCTNTNFASQLHSLRTLRSNCTRGAGGEPNFFLCDENVFLWYQKSMTGLVANPSYAKIDIPFDNQAFYGKPMVWDEFIPDVNNGTTASIPVASSGTFAALNLDFMGVDYDPSANFEPGAFVKPYNQLARTALVAWRGAFWTNHRRKHGVLYAIDTTVTS